MTSIESPASTLRPPPIAFLSAPHAHIPLEARAAAGQAAADLVRRLGLKSARLGPDCFCGLLRRRDPCGRYDCDLRDLSRKFLDHSTLLMSFDGEHFLMGNNFTDDDRKDWHLGPGAREPVGEDAERLRHVGLSWEVLETSPYFPGHTTSIIFRREKRPRGHYAPSRANLKSFVADKLQEGLLAGLDAGWRAGENVELARAKLDDATKTGDAAQIGRATMTLLGCAQTEVQATVATMKTMLLAVDFMNEVKAERAATEASTS